MLETWLFGVGAGLGAAILQDAGYVFSRLFVRRGGTPAILLAGTQFWMGGASLLLLAALPWMFGGPEFHASLWLPFAGSAYGSLFGQLFFFRAEKSMTPAVMSSMMGLRVVLIALLSGIIFKEHFSVGQYLAVGLAAGSAFVMNYAPGGKVHWHGLLFTGFSLLAYAFSDLSVMHLVRGIHTARGGMIGGALFAMCAVNIALAVTMLPLLFLKAFRQAHYQAAAPFAGSWLFKQWLLYLCYGWIGPVFGNVVLALRGPIELVMSAILVRRHVEGIENTGEKCSRPRQALGAGLMLAAIVLYTLG